MSDLVSSSLLLETVRAGLLVVLLAAALRFPKAGAAAFSAAGRWFRALAARPRLALAAAGLLPVLLRLAILPLNPPPSPGIPDEYGHLLLADTFISGRITNPPHPHWTSFETVYVLQKPTYTSQYQAATGAALAAGWAVFGHPWAGVICTMALLCAALYWMLRAWIGSEWALAGSLAMGLQIGVFNYWIDTYWGGGVPALGGVLAIGALPGLCGARRVRHAIVLAFGLAVVMNSRPVEALILLFVSCGYLIWQVSAGKLPARKAAVEAGIPALLLLLAALAAMSWYNWRVTGDPLEPPYLAHQKMYGTPQPFWWQAPVTVPPASFRNNELRDEYLRQRRMHARRSSPGELARAIAGRALSFWQFYLGVPLAIPLVFLPKAWPEPQVRFAALAGIPFALDFLTFHAFYPHYAAPALGLLLIGVVHGWRRMKLWRWRGRDAGLALSRALPLLLFAGVALPAAGMLADPFLPLAAAPVSKLWSDFRNDLSPRFAIEHRLRAAGGRHLIFVRYRQPGHRPANEWVYNAADIDNSPVVWARELDPAANSSLILYFRGRRVWLVQPDETPPLLSPYPAVLGAGFVRPGVFGP